MDIKPNDEDIIYLSCLICAELDKLDAKVKSHIDLANRFKYDRDFKHMMWLKDKLMAILKSLQVDT